jgi:MFS family permease
MIMLSFTMNILWLYIWYGVVLALGVNLTYFIPNVTTARKWFIKQAGLAASLTILGSGLGVAILPALIKVLAGALGWSMAFIVCGVIFGAVIILSALFIIRSKPEDMGLLPDGIKPEEVRADGGMLVRRTRPDGGNPAAAATDKLEVMWSLGEAFKTWPIYALFLGYACYSFGLQGAIGHAALWLRDLGDPNWGLALTFYCLPAAFTRIIGGWVADRTSKKWTMIISMLATVVVSLIFWLITGTSSTMAILFLVLYGITYGVHIALWGPYTGDIYGRLNVGMLFGFVTIGAGFVGGQGAVVWGLIYDATGSYNPALALNAVVYLVGALCVLATWKVTKKTKA